MSNERFEARLEEPEPWFHRRKLGCLGFGATEGNAFINQCEG